MKKLMKVASMISLFALVLAPMVNVEAKTNFTKDDWIVDGGDGRGTVTEVDDNITNLKGAETDEAGQYHGPYSTKSTETLANGISEEVNIELDPEGWAQGEYFTLTTSLNNADDEYVTETGIWVQKDGDTIYVYPTFDPDSKIEVTEKGVYTFQYNFTHDTEANKVYFTFNLKLWDEVIGSVENIDLTDPRITASGATEDPNTIVDIRKVWFNNIFVADGINVYTTLPQNPEEEIPEVPTEEETPNPPAETPVETPEANPDTSDINVIFFASLCVLAVAGLTYTIRKRKFN